MAMTDGTRNRYISLDATRLTYQEVRQARGQISPWVENRELLLPPVNNHKAKEQPPKREESPRDRSQHSKNLPISSTTRKLRLSPRPQLKRNTREIRYSDVTEMASLEPITAPTIHAERPMRELVGLSKSRKIKLLDFLTIDTDFTKQTIQPKPMDEDDAVKKQFSRFLYEMHSEVKMPQTSVVRRHNPVQFSRKRRIMQLLTLNRSNELGEKSEPPKNLKVAFDKFASFLPSYPRKRLPQPTRRMPLLKRQVPELFSNPSTSIDQ